MARAVDLVMVTYTNGNSECWSTEDELPKALLLAEKLTTDDEHQSVAEAFVYTDLYETDSVKWWQNCHFRREGAVVEREW